MTIQNIQSAESGRMCKAMTSLLMIAALATCGCKQTGFLAKREAEKSCPTDIRQTIPWCVGEDALFQCPCGPNANFYGYKPTCWGIWPTGGAIWRDTHCGPLHHENVINDLVIQNRELVELPQLESLPVESLPAESLPVAPREPSFPQEKSIRIDATREPETLPVETKEAADEAADEAVEEGLPDPSFGLIRLPNIKA